jgi:hypothetical protein
MISPVHEAACATPSRMRLTRRDVLWSSLGLMLAGCGSQPDNTPMPADEQGLRELAAVYRGFSHKNKRGPKTLKELQRKGQSYPNAFQMLKSGELIVQWGAPLSPEGESTDTVLAYFKNAPEQGGSVLLQDGNTIKKMTADEFKAAPKASAP